MKPLPIGIQHFDKLRENGYLYIDKTEFVHSLANLGGSFFLSRPRRFGKSLLISTLEQLFSGRKDLFDGLWIEDKWDWTRKNPTLRISFTEVNYENDNLENAIIEALKAEILRHEISLPEDILSIKPLFQYLLKNLFDKKGKIILLVDEYDKPIIDFLERSYLDQAKKNQSIMREFYSTLKDYDKYLHLFFITGVSKFSKVSLFSDLNHVRDLTVSRLATTALGYTQTEVEEHFADYIDDFLMKNQNFNRNTFLLEVKKWYNGYSWDGETSVYNPFGLLRFFEEKKFGNFWFTSGMPTFLSKRLFEVEYFTMERIATDAFFLEQYNLDNIEITSLMFQTGYLTILEKESDGTLILGYPNREVRDSLYSFLIKDFGHRRESSTITVKNISRAFRENDMETVCEILENVFNDLPYDVYNRSSEGLFHGLIHILFKYLGVVIDSEVHTKKGRADAIVKTENRIFVIEFKFNQSAQAALDQIKIKDYPSKFHSSDKKITAIGINFTRTARALDEILIEELI